MVRKACFREVEVGRSRRCIRQIMMVVVVVVRLGGCSGKTLGLRPPKSELRHEDHELEHLWGVNIPITWPRETPWLNYTYH